MFADLTLICEIATIPPGVRNFYRELGRLIRDRRKGISLSQAGLAANVGLSRTSITNIELGHQHLTVHMLFELANALGVEAQALLPNKKVLQKKKVLRIDPKHLPEGVAQAVEGLYQRVTARPPTRERSDDASGEKS